MTKNEVKHLLQWATANFPSMQEKDMRPTAALWEKMLGDLPYDVAESAMVKVLATTKFFPTVAEIREAAIAVAQPKGLTAAEAWGEVVQAISRFGQYRPDEAVASLSPSTARVVRLMGFRDLCISENNGVDRAHFLRMYEQIGRSTLTNGGISTAHFLRMYEQIDGKEQDSVILPERLRIAMAEIGKASLPAPRGGAQGDK